MLAAPRLVAAAAPGVSEDVPVPGGTAALAKALEIDPVPDRARFAAELARIICDDSKQRRTDVRSGPGGSMRDNVANAGVGIDRVSPGRSR